MEHPAYSFLLTMLHSVWQSAILIACYYLIISIQKQRHPLYKRNLLYILLLAQCIISICSFMMLQKGMESSLVTRILNAASLHSSWLQDNATVVLSLYAILVMAKLGSTFFTWQKFSSRYKKALSKAPAVLRVYSSTQAGVLGIKRKVQVWCSSAITSPLTFGFWKPVILMPLALVNNLSAEQAETLILHELTHIRHHDYVLNWLLVFAETVFFFNPFVHIISQKIKLEREKNCDALVLAFRPNAILYAETLLQISRFQQLQSRLQLAAVSQKKYLLRRVIFFTNSHNLEFSKNRSLLPIFALTLAITLNLFAALHISRDPLQPTPAKPPVPKQNIGTLATNELPAKLINARPVTNLANSISAKSTSKIVTAPRENRQEVLALSSEQHNESAYTSADPMMPLVPVSAKEIVIDSQDFVITNEAANGAKLTAAYRAVLLNGLWTLQPLWMITDLPVNDSTNIIADSAIQVYPAVQ